MRIGQLISAFQKTITHLAMHTWGMKREFNLVHNVKCRNKYGVFLLTTFYSHHKDKVVLQMMQTAHAEVMQFISLSRMPFFIH